MIRIKKLSTKMLIGLGVILLSLIVFQVFVSKRVESDREALRQSLDVEQMLSLLNNGELKTYRQHSVGEFSRINIFDAQTQIFKGDRFAVFASDYYRRGFEVSVENDELTIRLRSGANWETRELPVFIVMPTDPKYVFVNNGHFSGDVAMFGFSGEETWLRINNGWNIEFQTDMPNLNIRHHNNRLRVVSASMGDVQVLVESNRGAFSLSDLNSNSINAEILMIGSTLSQISIHPQSTVGTLSVHGTMGAHNHSIDNENINIIHNGQVDSLYIQLASNLESVRQLILSPELSSRYEHIEVSDNIIIERRVD